MHAWTLPKDLRLADLRFRLDVIVGFNIPAAQDDCVIMIDRINEGIVDINELDVKEMLVAFLGDGD